MIEINNKQICVKEISNMYGIKPNFFRVVLCRPEFNKYRYAGNIFKNCYGFHEQIKKIILLKQQASCSKLRKLKLPNKVLEINSSLN